MGEGEGNRAPVKSACGWNDGGRLERRSRCGDVRRTYEHQCSCRRCGAWARGGACLLNAAGREVNTLFDPTRGEPATPNFQRGGNELTVNQDLILSRGTAMSAFKLCKEA